MPVMVMNDYGRYLIFKTLADNGVISRPTGKYRSTYYTWMKKMVSRGWATRLPDGSIQLRSYQHVWSTLQVKRTRRRSSKTFGYQYHKLFAVTNSLDKSDFKSIIAHIRLHISDRKVSQLIHRLTRATGVSPRNTRKFKEAKAVVQLNEKPMLSCKKVAQMFGYKSAVSVYKDYGLFFSKVSQKRVLDVRYHHETKKMAFLFPCNRINLNLMDV
jgi:hypothetical protein